MAEEEEKEVELGDAPTRVRSNTADYNIYQPLPPLGIQWFEKTWLIATYQGTPIYIHVTIPAYLFCELIWSVSHPEPGHWLAYAICTLILQFLALLFHVLCTIWVTSKVIIPFSPSIDVHRMYSPRPLVPREHALPSFSTNPKPPNKNKQTVLW